MWLLLCNDYIFHSFQNTLYEHTYCQIHTTLEIAMIPRLRTVSQKERNFTLQKMHFFIFNGFIKQ